MHIKIKKGLDLPFQAPSCEAVEPMRAVTQIGATFGEFGDRLKLLVKSGDHVLIGTPLAEHKDHRGAIFASPACGKVGEIRRGERRRPLALEIEVDEQELFETFAPCDVEKASLQELIDHFKRSGLFFHLRKRPFSQICSPDQLPRSIFVKAIESAPGVPPAELQVEGFEEAFQIGLQALARIGPVHLVHRLNTPCRAFCEAAGVARHTVEGPHPSANPSLHIEAIDPIKSARDVVWTIDVVGAITIGISLTEQRYHKKRVVALAGPGIDPTRLCYVAARQGVRIKDLLLLAGDEGNRAIRHISGDPLTGTVAAERDFLGFEHTVVTALPEPSGRQLLHFMRLGLDKFTATKTYLSRLISPFTRKNPFSFTTQQHGDVRAFIDPSLYDAVMPMKIKVVELVKACLAEDFALADRLGLLGVVKEDFALPTFVCPSKIEMGQIIETALVKRALDET